MAVENDVHVLGVSTLAGGHKTLVPEVDRASCARSAATTSSSSSAASFRRRTTTSSSRPARRASSGPGTVIPVAAQKILETLLTEAA